MMTVADKWRTVALLRASLNELAKYSPQLEHAQEEIERIGELRAIVEGWVTNGVRQNPATFFLGCRILGLDPVAVRRALNIG